MLSRRHVIAAAAALPASALPPLARDARAQDAFGSFLAGIRQEALRTGIDRATLDAAFAGVRPNSKVLELDRHQPEFTMTWAQYRAKLITPQRIENGRSIMGQQHPLLLAVDERFRVTIGAVMGIWGLESSYGASAGSYNLIEALSTLAWDGRRSGYFRGELINALRILQHGDVSRSAMTSGWAGAMGQPQFMPGSYLKYAVDFDGDGRRDIWHSTPDVLGSIANYLARMGWRYGEPWGQPVSIPAGFDATLAGRENQRPLGEWIRLGVRRDDGSAFSRTDVPGALVLPDGPGGEAFMTYANFGVIRRYNPSDFYALAVGLIGDGVA
jgi:membrane-bound lytic murein transglycosylase B